MNKKRLLKIVPIFGAFAVCLPLVLKPSFVAAKASDEELSALARFGQLNVQAQLGFTYNYEYYDFEPVTCIEDVNDYDNYIIARDHPLLSSGGKIEVLAPRERNSDEPSRGMNSSLANCYQDYLKNSIQYTYLNFKKSEEGNYYTMKFSHDSSECYIGTTEEAFSFDYEDPIPACSLFESKFVDLNKIGLNPNFSIDFVNNSLCLRPYGMTETAYNNKLLTFAKGAQKIGFFDFLDTSEYDKYSSKSDVKLFRQVAKPNWSGNHYRKINKISNVVENEEYVLVTPKGIQYEGEFHQDIALDGYLSKSQTLVETENGDTRDFMKATSDQEIWTFVKDSSSELYKIHAENKGYLCTKATEMFGYLDMDYDENGDLFDLTFNEKGNLKIVKHETDVDYILLSRKGMDVLNGNLRDYIFAGVRPEIVRDLASVSLYKKTNFDTLFKAKPNLVQVVGDDYVVDSEVMSVRLQLSVPSDVYDVLKTDYKFFMKYELDPTFGVSGDEQTVIQPLTKPHYDDQGNVLFTVVFKNIPIKDIDINITAVCYVSSDASGEEKITYSRSLNSGNGYTIREIAQKYLSMEESQNPDEVAEFNASIKPHKEILSYIANYTVGA